MKRHIHCLILLLTFAIGSFGQKPVQYNSAETYDALQQLNTVLSVLYIAAHPDDENQRLISYFANKHHAYTSYLSLTRGDGGQNLLGSEIGQLLGVLRTQELLGARRTDGGHQYFTRAIDFGYSKHPDETFGFWNEDEVLGDVVRTIRRVKPDIIINRFDHRTPGKTHGHHTASAMLSVRAFDLAGDRTAFSDQLSTLGTWQPSKLYFNTSWWFYGGKDKFAQADKSNLVSVDIAEYYPLLGKSNSEIAAAARSMHKCQGFGMASTRASRLEYLETINTIDNLSKEPLEGIDTSWGRINGGKAIGDKIQAIIDDYDFTAPEKSLSALVNVYEMIARIDDPFWKNVKMQECRDIIQSITGLYLEATTEATSVTNLDSIEVVIEATHRSSANVSLSAYRLPEMNISEQENRKLDQLQENKWYVSGTLPQQTNTQYWLNGKNTYGAYYVADEDNIGKPESDAVLNAEFDINIDGKVITFYRPVTSLNVKPEQGEVYQPLWVVPPVSVDIADDVYVYDNNESKTITVTVQSNTSNIKGQLSLNVENGWKVDKKNINVSIPVKGGKQTYQFELTPPKGNKGSKTDISVDLSVNGNTHHNRVYTIDYTHIPTQRVSIPETAKAVKIDIKTAKNNRIAYIQGAGDKVPDCLAYVGYDVTELSVDELSTTDLSQYQAVILGIRLYNVNAAMSIHQKALFDYVEKGGNLITQYTTTWSLKVDSIAPLSLELGRGRISDETAEVTLLQPNHPALAHPNQITKADFDGWVQERGLYFPAEYDTSFEQLLSMADPNEDAQRNALLVAQVGEGYFVYTGLSFFRELPAGVPGAYRLLSNLISLGSNE